MRFWMMHWGAQCPKPSLVWSCDYNMAAGLDACLKRRPGIHVHFHPYNLCKLEATPVLKKDSRIEKTKIKTVRALASIPCSLKLL